MESITMEQMLQAGVQFGHRTSKWHPKMEEHIFGMRNGIHIIDLASSVERLEAATQFAHDIAKKGGTVLFVGTKRQATGAIEEAAKSCGMPYVSGRWLGGTFTNFKTIITQTKRLIDLEQQQASGEFEKYTKKEQLAFSREIEKLRKDFGGLVAMKKLPDAVFLVDLSMEQNALAEAKLRNIPVIAMADTNVDPRQVEYPIPANDDAISSISLVAQAIADSVAEGVKSYVPPKETSEENKASKVEQKLGKIGSADVDKKKTATSAK